MPKKNLVEHLAQYAAYHRDRRNILTHFIGIPLIVLAVSILLSRPGIAVGGLWLAPATLLAAVTAHFYLRLDRPLGLLMTAFLLLCLGLAAALAQAATGTWLSAGLGLFVFGWIVQFVGHAFEGRKPAFVDDLMGLIIGPLFVAAELAFLLGLRRTLQRAVEERAGPTRSTRPANAH